MQAQHQQLPNPADLQDADIIVESTSSWSKASTDALVGDRGASPARALQELLVERMAVIDTHASPVARYEVAKLPGAVRLSIIIGGSLILWTAIGTIISAI